MGLAMSSNINWNEDKKARGLDDYDLGEVLEIQDNVVVTQKGILDKDNFYLPDKHGRQIYGHNV
jgi:hypothetical protein